jgi:serine/threonine protein phosphatase 1
VNEKFAELGSPRRIWAVAAMHGDVDRLATLHDHIATRFAVRDRLVYLGNYLGVESRTNMEMMDELLAFRSALLAKTGVEPSDIVFMRGPAEEAWQRLLRLQFAPLPHQTLEKLLASGVEAYLRLYGVSVNDTRSVARAGSLAITRFTNNLRSLQRNAAGHEKLMFTMRRAAYTNPGIDQKRLLLVPASFDPARSLDDQGESLWWTAAPFRVTGRAQAAYNRIVRGFDSVNGGADLDDVAVTLDSGCGRGGPLVCGCFTPTGKLAELIVAGGRGLLESSPYEREVANDLHASEEMQTIVPIVASSYGGYGRMASA